MDVPAGTPLFAVPGLVGFSLNPFRFDANSVLGDYHLVVTPLDAAGRSGASLDFTGTLNDATNGLGTVSLSGFTPAGGEPGATVILNGTALNYVTEAYYNDLPIDLRFWIQSAGSDLAGQRTERGVCPEDQRGPASGQREAFHGARAGAPGPGRSDRGR